MSHTHTPAAADDSQRVKTNFGGVVLVCRECEDRKNGPSKLRAKDVRRELKRGLVQSVVRLRIVECSCLGLCPRKAISVTAVTPNHALLAAELCAKDDAAAFAGTMVRSFE
jgi:predicted metal-binding protein